MTKKHTSSKEYQFLVFSDLHAHPHRSFFFTTEEGINSRLQTAIDVLRQIKKFALEKNIRDILFAGDLFEANKNTPLFAIHSVYREINQWSSEGIKLLMIPGNHDYLVRNGEQHALELFTYLENVTVEDATKQFVWNMTAGQQLAITVVPFQHKMQQEWFSPLVQEQKGAKAIPSICVTHGVISGAKLHHKREVDTQILPSYADAIIPTDWLKDFAITIAGHIHLPQWDAKNRVLIPGQPWLQYPYETGQQRGFWEIRIVQHLSLSTENIFEVECILHTLDVPEFVFLRLLADGTLLRENGEPLTDDEDVVDKNIVLLTPVSLFIDDAIILKAKEELERKGAYYVEIMPSKTTDSGHSDNEPRIILDAYSNPEEVLDRVLGSGLVDIGEFKREELVSTGKRILEYANRVLAGENIDELPPLV